jgi:hypothetical protein
VAISQRAVASSDDQVIERFLSNWMPFAMLPPDSRARTSVLRFVTAESQEERKRALRYASLQYRLQDQYSELGVLRTDRPSDAFRELLALSLEQIALDIRQGDTQEFCYLLQRAFEFGRQPVPPQHNAARQFLREFLALQPGGPNMKYCIYPNGIPFSGGGKTHEELAREFVATGLGGGLPQCGGVIYRIEPLRFTFDMSSTAFRTSIRPEGVRQAILRWIRTTGGDEQRLWLV